MAQNERLRYLFEKYLDKTFSLQEKDELFQYISEVKYDEDLMQVIKETWDKEFALHEQDSRKADIIFQNIIEQRAKTGGKVRKLRFLRYAAAASILFLLSAGAYFIFNNETTKQIVKTEDASKRFKNDVPPGGNRAILTLANGTQIILDSVANGTLTKQSNTQIIKLDSGQLAYNLINEKPSEVLYNTITTPRGGQYQIILADGSKVWLNAVSSLKFPTAFVGKERNVELKGEGYFEVAKNASMPFHVKVNDMQVEVLGTHFNVNAYDDEAAMKTTLLEGSVKVTKGNTTGLLKPGQQAQLNKDGEIKVLNDVDVEEAVAWKNGFFQFSNASIESVMRQVGKWYDVDVQYDNKISQVFKGEVPRRVNISTLLEILESTGWVHFKIDGRKVTVMP